MAIRMKEWGMLAAPGQPANIRTQGLHGWERAGHSLGKGLADVLGGAGRLGALSEKVNNTGELAAFTEQLRGISAEVRAELAERDIRDWDYSWNNAMAPRLREAVQGLAPGARSSAMELAQLYSAQASIEAQRDRSMQRISTARGHWEQQVEAAVASGQEEQAARWMEAARGVFVPEGQLEERLSQVRSRACLSRLESRLQDAPLQALAELSSGGEKAPQSLRGEDARRLEQSCARARRSLRRELAATFSESLRAGEEPEPATLELATGAGIMPQAPLRAGGAGSTPSAEERSAWRRWVDAREDGEEGELDARLAIAAAPLPLEERRALLSRLERSAKVPAADRRTLSNRLFALYNSGALGCPGDAEAQRALLELQEEGAALLASQGADAVARWVESRRAGADNWVCFDE